MRTDRKRRWTLRMVQPVMWMAAVLTFATPHAASAGQVADADSASIQNVIESQIRAFKAGDNDQAYSYAAPVIQRLYPNVERFIAMVQSGYLPLYNPESFVFGRSIDVEGAVHQELIVTDETGKQWQAVYTMQRQDDGSWKITGVKMNPYSGAST